MRAASKEAFTAGGLVIGILPDERGRILPGYPNEYVPVPIYTGMSDARDAIIARTSDLVAALKGSFGTISKVALALKSRHPGHVSVLPGVRLHRICHPAVFIGRDRSGCPSVRPENP